MKTELRRWLQPFSLAFAVLAAGTAEPAEIEPGTSEVTVADTTRNAFGRSLGNLQPAHWPRVLAGKKIFSRRWQVAPEEPSASHLPGAFGLGPRFNARSCTGCHFKDGRGSREGRPDGFPELIFRLDARGEHGWGAQLQEHTTTGKPEGRVEIRYDEIQGRYPDGTAYALRRPVYRLAGAGTTPQLSPRVAPTLVGLGLLEAVEEAMILEWADPLDLDQDGISGRPGIPSSSRETLGRFGWKASRGSIRGQVVGALAEDMGILAEEREITPQDLELLVDYLRFLAPPAKRPASQQASRGAEIFSAIGCASCHRPTLVTAPASSLEAPKELAGQLIAPYTDLLLHDLGEGLADDGVGETAGRREWRTAPLWGLGLLPVVSGRLHLLHDGRARSFEEAILWHGGEAFSARTNFEQLSRQEREALVAFLETL